MSHSYWPDHNALFAMVFCDIVQFMFTSCVANGTKHDSECLEFMNARCFSEALLDSYLISRRANMRKSLLTLPTLAAAFTALGVVAMAPAMAQTIFEGPDEAVGGARVIGETEPFVGPYGDYAYARGSVVVRQCGFGFGCRYYSLHSRGYVFYPNEW
jgi:hypothetical protein